MTSPRVFVSGAAGFIGYHVCRTLLADGWEVVGLDSCDGFYDPSVKRRRAVELTRLPGCTMLEGDVRDEPVLSAALRDVVAAVHLAARPGVRQSLTAAATYDAVNVGGTRAVLAGCVRHGIDRVVFASSSSVYGAGATIPFREDRPLGDPTSPYAATKRVGEVSMAQAARAYGLRAAILRLFSIYGPHQRPDLALHRFTAALWRGEPIRRFGDGRSARDYTHAGDAARAVSLALAWTGGGASTCQTFNIGAGRPVRLDWLISTLGRAAGTTPEIRAEPAHAADLPVTCADRAKAAAVLGWRPERDLESGIAEFVAWYGETHGHKSRTAA